MRTLTISLPADQVERLEDAVRTGEYASDSDVVRQALSLWQAREAETRRLKQAYDEGIASGPGRKIDPQALLAELKAEKHIRG